MTYEWKNKVVFITGAATGIGSLVVRKLAAEGAKHIRVLDINEKAGIEFQNELNSKYGANKVKFVKCDITDEDKFVGELESLAKTEGLDAVINNAGIMNDSWKAYKKMIAVNVTALVTATLKGIELMSKENGGKGGAIINISSIAALTRKPLLPIYCGTKSLVLQFSYCIGMDDYYSRTGVRVITMCFGATDTPLLYESNMGNFDKTIESTLGDQIKTFPLQTPDNAAQGVVDSYKLGENGSTWLSISNKPVKNISGVLDKAFDMFTEAISE